MVCVLFEPISFSQKRASHLPCQRHGACEGYKEVRRSSAKREVPSWGSGGRWGAGTELPGFILLLTS